MDISLTQLLVGFKSGLTIRGLADYLGVDDKAVRARLRQLTADEEATINKVMDGSK
jgi:predicted ArsR family transcriptional regulator